VKSNEEGDIDEFLLLMDYFEAKPSEAVYPDNSTRKKMDNLFNRFKVRWEKGFALQIFQFV
jgi:hypothetical protein